MNRPLSHHLAAVAAALAFSTAASAGPSQSQIDPPGGFATACASEISSGTTYTPGLDLTAVFAFWTGRYACQSQVFAGAAGQASATAAWTTAKVQNQSTVRAGMGEIHFSAQDQAPTNLQFPIAVAGGGWSERMVVDLAGHTGESATWLFHMDADGSLAAAANGLASVMMNVYKDEHELGNKIVGFDKGGSDGFTTDAQRVSWGVGRSGSRTIDDQVTFAVPVVLGKSFVWGVYGTVRATTAAFGGGGGPPSTAEADFLHTLHYGGSAGLLLGGQQVGGYTLSSASGIDWLAAAPVPEPGSWALWAAGTLLILRRVRHRGA